MPLSLGSIASAAGGAAGLAGGGAASALTYSALRSKYNDFSFPMAAITINGKPLVSTAEKGIVVNDIHVELTSGFEASVASFRIYNVFDTSQGKFRYEDLKAQVFMGAPVSISLGYVEAMETVFVGFIAGVAFGYEPEDLPYIQVTAMDVKSIMMGGTYSYQLTAKTYGEAVTEIFKRTGYEKLKAAGGITALQIGDTPDKKAAPAPGGGGAGAQKKASPETIEMVAESDYEFVVKAAKKFNFEFFVDRGCVIFRKAKSNTAPLASIGVSSGILGFHVEYSLTGLVSSIEARSSNPGDGKLIKHKANHEGDISTNSKAKTIIGDASKVYVDPSITSQEQATARVESLMEQMRYRLGSLEADCVGMPDLVPGRFLDVAGMGAPADNSFYLTSVVHDFTPDGGYHTKLIGCAAEIKTAEGAGGMGGMNALGGGSSGSMLGSLFG